MDLPAPTYLPGYMVLVPVASTDGSSTPRSSNMVAYMMPTAPIPVPSSRSSTDATTGIVLSTEQDEARREVHGSNVRRKGI